MRAISALSFEAGTSTLGSLARTPLRIRLIMSATGSVMFIWFTSRAPLPARLDHAGDVPGQGQLAEADAAQLELPQVATGPAAAAAARVSAGLQRPLPLGLCNERQPRPYSSLLSRDGTALPSRR